MGIDGLRPTLRLRRGKEKGLTRPPPNPVMRRAAVAQLVERLAVNEVVPGSSPGGGEPSARPKRTDRESLTHHTPHTAISSVGVCDRRLLRWGLPVALALLVVFLLFVFFLKHGQVYPSPHTAAFRTCTHITPSRVCGTERPRVSHDLAYVLPDLHFVLFAGLDSLGQRGKDRVVHPESLVQVLNQ